MRIYSPISCRNLILASFALLSCCIIPLFKAPYAYASAKIFADNFDNDPDGAFPSGWEVLGSSCNATWKVVNKTVGIKIVNEQPCASTITPDDDSWNSLGDNYSFELDMHIINGTDHNIPFRISKINNDFSFYELHFQTPGDFVLDGSGGVNGSYTVNSAQIYQNNQTYHVKIVVNKRNLKVFIDNQLVRDFTATDDSHSIGRIGLRAGVGSDPNSETYFDNIVVTSLDSSLDVPYFSQNSLPWGPSEYDHTVSLGASNTTMDRWGCAVTSVAMLLNYYGMTQMKDGTPLDPGSLNEWLRNNHGYSYGYGKDGEWYSSIYFSAIPRLTKELVKAGKSNTELEYKLFRQSDASTTLLHDDIATKNMPGILRVANAKTSGHFVVAKGLTGNTFTINDPEWNSADLTSFDNTYSQYERFIPSHTDLSYLTIVTNPNTDLVITDPQGRRTGKKYSNTESYDEYDEIPDAQYFYDEPISNPDVNDNPENLGTGDNIFLLPKPPSGKYTFSVSSLTNTPYEINVSAIDNEGNSSDFKFPGDLDLNATDTYVVNYASTSATSIQKEVKDVTFQDVISDIDQLYSTSDIHKKATVIELKALIRAAQIASYLRNKTPAMKILDTFDKTISKMKDNQITDEAYSLLHEDYLGLIIAH